MAGPRHFWQRTLAGVPPLLELYLDRPRPAALGAVAAATVRHRVDGVGVHRLAQACGVDADTVLCAGVQALIARLSGMELFLLGIVSGSELLPLRCDFADGPAVAEVLARTHAARRDAIAHRGPAFAELVELAGAGVANGAHPLVQAAVQLRDTASTTPARRGLDLGFSFIGTDVELQVEIGYRRELWDHGSVARFAAYLAQLLDGMAADPTRPSGAVPMLPAGEIPVAGSRSPDTDRDPTLMHELVLARAAAIPDEIAVVHDDESVTYAELADRAGALARRLRAVGAGPDHRIGVCLDRSVDLVVALLGVLISGAAYLPLDPAHPAERIAFMAGDGGLTAVITTESLLPLVVTAGVPVLEVNDALAGDLTPEAGGEAGSAEDLAYVIYTSGSTGTPKGVAISHRSLVNHMRWMVATFGIGPGERVLQRSSFSFDGSVWEFWLPLMTGGTLVMVDPERHADLAYLTEHMRRHRITTAQLGPHLLTLFLDQDDVRVPTLRTIFCGGEQMGADLPARVAAFGAHLHNLYGPTEVTMNGTAWTTRPDQPGPVPIGVPVTNTVLYVLDRWGAPLPPGAVGELFVGGTGVARGYLNRPGLTASRFVADPFPGRPGGRLYRTGDRVRQRMSGEFEFLGRVDDQVKLRGFRVELGEVEAAVRASPDVAEAVVTVAGEGEAARLVAYIVPAR